MTQPLPHPDHLHSTVQAAAALGVPAARIRRWLHDEKVAATGRIDGRGGSQPLFYLAELQPLADAFHAGRDTTRRRTV